MITAERKPLGEIKGFLEKYNRILVVGCGTCVTVCFAGGEQEVKTVSSALRIGFNKNGAKKEFFEDCVIRQCDPEYIDQIIKRVANDKIRCCPFPGLWRGRELRGGAYRRCACVSRIEHGILRGCGGTWEMGGNVRWMRGMYTSVHRRHLSHSALLQKPDERSVRRKRQRQMRDIT